MSNSLIKSSFAIFLASLCITSMVYGVAGGRLFDPATVETVTGQVVKVEKVGPNLRMGTGTHLILKTEDGELDVRLGPSDYLEYEGLTIVPNDNLTITGSKVSFNNQEFMIASQVEKEGKTYQLRNEDGIPNWSFRSQMR